MLLETRIGKILGDKSEILHSLFLKESKLVLLETVKQFNWALNTEHKSDSLR